MLSRRALFALVCSLATYAIPSMCDVRGSQNARVADAQAATQEEAQTALDEADRLAEAGDHGHARLAYEQASQLFEKLSDSLGQAHALLALANLELAHRRTAEARRA